MPPDMKELKNYISMKTFILLYLNCSPHIKGLDYFAKIPCPVWGQVRVSLLFSVSQENAFTVR